MANLIIITHIIYVNLICFAFQTAYNSAQFINSEFDYLINLILNFLLLNTPVTLIVLHKMSANAKRATRNIRIFEYSIVMHLSMA